MENRTSVQNVLFLRPRDLEARRWFIAKAKAINVIVEEIGRLLDWADERVVIGSVLAELSVRWEKRREELAFKISSDALSSLRSE